MEVDEDEEVRKRDPVLRARVLERVSDFRKALRQGNGQDIHLTQARAATGAFGLTTALTGVVESQARSISN